MAKYIDRDSLIEWLKRIPLKDLSDGLGLCRVIMEDDFKKAIKNMPENIIVDVAPVVHGRWEKWNGDDRHHCTVCECYANAERDSYGYIENEFLDNYCQNCGAQMHEDDFCSYGERKEDKVE